MNGRLLLIDAVALAFRGHYAFINRPLTRADGRVTSALFGYCNTLITLLTELRPTHAAAAMDTGRPTFRNALYPEYKAHRPPCPPELSWQLGALPAASRALGLANVAAEGFEADDVIAALTLKGRREGLEVLIFSGDKDFLQLLAPGVAILKPTKDTLYERIEAKDVPAQIGVEAHQVSDYLALLGDASDNVPGAPGVGKVTACKLISQYGSLAKTLEAAPAIPQKNLAASLTTHREQILLSHRLVELNHEVPGLPAFEDLRYPGLSLERAEPWLQEYEFPKMRARLGELAPAPPATPALPAAEKRDTGCASAQDAAAIEDFFAAVKPGQFALEAVHEGSPPRAAQLLGLACASDRVIFLPWPLPFLEARERERALAALARGLKAGVGGHDLKPVLQILRREGVALLPAFDTLLEATLLHPGHGELELEQLCQALDIPCPAPAEFLGTGRARRSLKAVAREELAAYAGRRAAAALELHRRQSGEIASAGMQAVLNDLELPLLPAIAAMEWRGVALDASKLAELDREAAAAIARLTREIHTRAGEEFNINSTQQLGLILFEKLKVHEAAGLKARRNKVGYVTDSDVLESLAPLPIAAALLQYRSWSKLLSTYIHALPAEVLPGTGHIHTQYQQNGAATGRLSSSRPNLQNIPLRSAEGARIREAFVPSGPGRVLLSADYSQIELRVMAHFSRDPALLEAFAQGLDIHAATAARVHGVGVGEVTREQRSRAKAVNFGLLYGMGPRHLASSTGLKLSEAKEFIEHYFASFPSVRAFIEHMKREAEERGYATTLAGRRRPLPGLKSSNSLFRNAAQNMAINTPIQGSAADIIKWAMVRLYQQAREHKLPLEMLLQVHDELVFECPAEAATEMTARVRSAMEDHAALPWPFDVPLVVEVHQGLNWLAAHS